MLTRHLRVKLTRVVAVAALGAAGVTTFASGGSPAGADPKQLDAFVAVGSDTTQDILNAFAGFTSGKNYTPLQSATTAKRQVISFDAVPQAGASDNCITVKVKAATIYRPNGSTQGRRALSRAIDGTGYGPTGQCGGTKDVSGMVDIARSSSGPSSGDTGTALTYVPFARDGMSFGYYRAGGLPVTTLTRAQLTSLFTTGPQVIDGVRIVPCGIQTGSGTYAFWQTVTTASATQEAAATSECNGLGGVPDSGGRLQENSGAQLQAKGALVPAGDQVVVGFSAANFISQSNGVVTNDLGTGGVDLGSISNNGSGTDLGLPYQGTAPSLTPRAAFFSDATFGRSVYNVFNTAIIDSAFGNTDIKNLFKGATSVSCAAPAQATVNLFGFLTPSNCGASTLKGSLISGIQ